MSPVQRAPLGPFPEPQTYDHVLPFTPPAGADVNFYRGNFCGIRIPGAPAVPGSNAANPECIMSALLDVYPDNIVDAFLQKCVEDGYTHLQRSMSHALYYTSFDRFLAVSKKAKSMGLFNDVWFIANEFPGFQFNQDASFWKPLLDPYIDQILGEGLVDCACPCWQMDQIMQSAPGNATISIIAYVADRLPQSVPVFTHWMNEALAWWKTGGEQWADKYQSIWIENRFDWWRAMNPYLTGGHHQGDTQIAKNDPKLYQDKMKDTLDYFGGRTDKGNMGQSLRGGQKPFNLTVFECSAQDQFDGKTSEDQGDQTGYILMCTTGWNGSHLGGYGNGARKPDGWNL